MSTFIQIYDQREQAQDVIRALFAAGCTSTTVRVIRSTARTAVRGATDQWAYEEELIARQGSFADVDPAYHDTLNARHSSFADVDPAYHDTLNARHGSFADIQPASALAEQLNQAGVAAHEAASLIERVRHGATLLLITAPPREVGLVVSIIQGGNRKATCAEPARPPAEEPGWATPEHDSRRQAQVKQ